MKQYQYRLLHNGCYGQQIWLDWVDCTFETASALELGGDPLKVQIRTITPGVA